MDKPGKGRPTKYDPIYCEEVIEFMAQGYSYEAFAGSIKVSKQTLYDWEKVHPDFLDSKREAFAACQIFWETLGIKGCGGSIGFNASGWIFNMKNRFSWRDKPKDDDESKPINVIYNVLPKQ